jgi:hypothetical protein
MHSKEAFRKPCLLSTPAWFAVLSALCFTLSLYAGLVLWSGGSDVASAPSVWVTSFFCFVVSASFGLLVMVLLHVGYMRPIARKLENSEKTLVRAQLMQSAIRPALTRLRDGIERHGRTLEVMRAVLKEGTWAQSQIDGKTSGPMQGAQTRVLDALKDLKIEMNYQQQTARSLIAAHETVAARLLELGKQLQSVKHPNKTDKNLPDSTNKGTVIPESGEDWLFSKNKSDSGKNDPLNWPGETAEPLLPDYPFRDEHSKRRFDIH